MLALIESQLTNFLIRFTYFALIFVLVIAGLGVPIPEDIPLLFSGHLCSKKHSPIADLQREAAESESHKPVQNVPNLYLMMLSGMIGVLMGDSVVFFIGRRGINGQNFVARHLRKVLHSKRRERVEHHFARHGNLTVFAGRFMPGFRSIVFAFAGMSKMSYPRFLLIDGAAAAISVPFFIWLGWHFADRFAQLESFLNRTKHIVGPIILGLLIMFALIYYLRKRRLDQKPEARSQ
ncbi:MAG: DedA family protein [Phycisphaerales bacterium]|nr:DedA family protein [Phycisphaerales bacterium]